MQSKDHQPQFIYGSSKISFTLVRWTIFEITTGEGTNCRCGELDRYRQLCTWVRHDIAQKRMQSIALAMYERDESCREERISDRILTEEIFLCIVGLRIPNPSFFVDTQSSGTARPIGLKFLPRLGDPKWSDTCSRKKPFLTVFSVFQRSSIFQESSLCHKRPSSNFVWLGREFFWEWSYLFLRGKIHRFQKFLKFFV